MAITMVTWPTCGTPKQGTSGRRKTSFPSPRTPQNPSCRGRMTRATPSSKSVQQRTNTLSGPRGELEAGDEILYAAWFFDLTDQEQVQGEQTDGDIPDGGHTGAHDHRTTNPEGRHEDKDEIPYAARFLTHEEFAGEVFLLAQHATRRLPLHTSLPRSQREIKSNY